MPTTEAPVWTLGDRLRKARQRAGLEQQELAEKLGVTRVSLSSWERDAAQPRDLMGLVKRWADATGVPLAWLLGVDSSTPSSAWFTADELRYSAGADRNEKEAA